ncbi:uncharacterized protein LOC109612097 [Musca domestica]|uniref:Uncharacterized protein LOC109612097 n=1 Tax=Musca domestica TaxID=7370 RepID=A0A9J7DDL3_MUSDO|nr:uncharacterized protein LOC109612097 [Musca domestica]
MKKILVICSILLGAKLSSCAPSPPNDQQINEAYEFYHTMSAFAADLRPMIEAVLHDIPEEENFLKHKMRWEHFLQKFQGEKIGDECVEKLLEILEPFADFIDELKQGHVTQEAETMEKLFQKHGLEQFSGRFLPIFQDLKIPDSVFDGKEVC